MPNHRPPAAGGLNRAFTNIASAVSHRAGRPATFVSAIAIIVIWAISGPVLGFSETWQLVINTGTTIITFLMVFVVQNSQNRTAPPSKPSSTS